MKRNFSFLSKKGQSRGAGQAVAAFVMALALTVSGAGTTLLLASQPTGLVVAPSSEQIGMDALAQEPQKPKQQGASSEETSEPQSTVSEETPATEPETEAPAESSASSEQPAAAPETTAQPEAPEAAETPAVEQPAVQTEAPVVNLEEENSVPHFQEETPELAAEDPLSAPTTAAAENDAAASAAEAAEANAYLLTPEQIEQALNEGALDETELNLEDENCLKWLWNWLFGRFSHSNSGSETVRPEYSGWRTDSKGRTYYYDPSTHQALTGLHTIDGVLYFFNGDGVKQDVTFGIDVSKYQTNIDWKKVKTSGVQFVIVRLGYRGYVSGTLVEDPMFEEHFTNARNSGLRVGVYIFSQAVNEDEAREEAIASAYVLNGRSLDYPIYFDSEASGSTNGTGRADGLGTDDRTKCAVAFCEEVKVQGYKPGVYASTRWFQKRLNLSALNGYSIWNAHYNVLSSGIDCDMWQCTYQGKVNGYSGSIDVNISYTG